MKETKKTLIIIIAMILTILGIGLYYNIVLAANGVGSNPNADIINGYPYLVSLFGRC